MALAVNDGERSWLSDYAVVNSGDYFIRIANDVASAYTLIVAVNAGLDVAANENAATAPYFPRSLTLLGAIGGATGSSGTDPVPTNLPINLKRKILQGTW